VIAGSGGQSRSGSPVLRRTGAGASACSLNELKSCRCRWAVACLAVVGSRIHGTRLQDGTLQYGAVSRPARTGSIALWVTDVQRQGRF
jgi:hypothetical protein